MAEIDCGASIGIVSRQAPSVMSLEEPTVYAVTHCDEASTPVGSFLVIDAGSRLYLARVAEVQVADVYAVARTPVLTVEQELAMELRYTPRLIKLVPVSECRDGTCGPPTTPVPIHARVRRPSPGEVTRMLGLPQDGLTLGELADPSGEALPGETVRLPLHVLRHHVLVVGTTGSGKTTLLKNLALQISRMSDAAVLALDVVGHFHHLAINDVGVRVIYPVTNGLLRRVARRAHGLRSVARALARRYLARAFASFGIRVRRFRLGRVGLVRGRRGARLVSIPVEAVVEVGGSERRISVELLPWALRTRDVIRVIASLAGILTQQARMFYDKVLDEIRARTTASTFREIYEWLRNVTEEEDTKGRRGRRTNYAAIAEELGIHQSTMENIMRAFLALSETGLFDVTAEARGTRIAIAEPNPRTILSPGYTVADLAGLDAMQQRIIVYRLLSRAYSYMSRRRRDRPSTLAILIDEAHLFFPQTRQEEEKEVVETHLTRITRLGRSRGIAVVFATHTPDDLNNTVLQLTNTKIIFRSEERILEKLGVPSSERRFLSAAATGLAYVKSMAYRHPIYVRIRPEAYHVG